MAQREHDDAAEDDERYVVVPSTALSASALDGLLEEYITREGTDYGERVYTLEEKKLHLKQLVDRGEVVIAFDLASESSTLLRADALPALPSSR